MTVVRQLYSLCLVPCEEHEQQNWDDCHLLSTHLPTNTLSYTSSLLSRVVPVLTISSPVGAGPSYILELKSGLSQSRRWGQQSTGAGLGRISEKWPNFGFGGAGAEIQYNLTVVIIVLINMEHQRQRHHHSCKRIQKLVIGRRAYCYRPSSSDVSWLSGVSQFGFSICFRCSARLM